MSVHKESVFKSFLTQRWLANLPRICHPTLINQLCSQYFALQLTQVRDNLDVKWEVKILTFINHGFKDAINLRRYLPKYVKDPLMCNLAHPWKPRVSSSSLWNLSGPTYPLSFTPWDWYYTSNLHQFHWTLIRTFAFHQVQCWEYCIIYFLTFFLAYFMFCACLTYEVGWSQRTGCTCVLPSTAQHSCM